MKIKLCFSIFFLGLGSVLVGQFGSRNQEQTEKLPIISKSYYIENANIKTDPFSELFRGSILIEDGLITSVGKDVNATPEAIKLNGDSLFVYAGFISGLSHAGIPEKKRENGGAQRENVKDPGNPPNDLAGITPETKVLEYLSVDEKSISELRMEGFTAALTVPRGQMMPGQSALILLSGESKEDLIFRESLSLYSQFSGARGMYPATVIGVMAKWRQLFRQSALAQLHEQAYQKNPSGIKHPKYEVPVKALFPIVNKSLPVVFNTEQILSIHRALQLQFDLDFSLILANVKQGWPAIDQIKEKKVPVFLSLDLPEEKDKKEERKEQRKPEEEKKKIKKKNEKTEKKEEKDPVKTEEQKRFEQRKMDSMAAYIAQASAFEKAGVAFGFSTIDTKSKEIRSNLTKMIKSGLSENQALAALTSYPSMVFGLSGSMGSIENGKLANLVISDQPIFTEDASIRYVFVEGTKYEFEKKKKKESEEDKDK